MQDKPVYINASPASPAPPAPEKCINTSPAVYINTSPASPAPDKCINTYLAMQALYKYFYGAGEVYINTSPAFFGDR